MKVYFKNVPIAAALEFEALSTILRISQFFLSLSREPFISFLVLVLNFDRSCKSLRVFRFLYTKGGGFGKT